MSSTSRPWSISSLETEGPACAARLSLTYEGLTSLPGWFSGRRARRRVANPQPKASRPYRGLAARPCNCGWPLGARVFAEDSQGAPFAIEEPSARPYKKPAWRALAFALRDPCAPPPPPDDIGEGEAACLQMMGAVATEAEVCSTSAAHFWARDLAMGDP